MCDYFMVNERFLIDLFRASFPSNYSLSLRENQFCEVQFVLKGSWFLFLARSLMLFASNLEDDEIFIFNDLMPARSAFDLRRFIEHRLHELQENWSFSFLIYVQKSHYYLLLLQEEWIGKPWQECKHVYFAVYIMKSAVAPRLDVSSVRRLDMFGLLPFTETIFAVLSWVVNALLAPINCPHRSRHSLGSWHTNKFRLLMTMQTSETISDSAECYVGLPVRFESSCCLYVTC